MSVSSFILRSGVASLACLSFLASPVTAASYQLEDNFSGASFFDNFDFFTAPDPTNGFVNYISQTAAQGAGLLTAADGAPATFGVDHTTVLNATSGPGRNSVRLSSKKSYTHALIIADIEHMPGGICGSWPAFWTLGPDWPNNGEIDIIEGVNDAAYNLMSLHTSPGCTIAGGNQTGTLQTNNCDTSLNYNAGCGVTASTTNSYGTGFNGGLGGVYATEWTSDFIRVWFFARGSIPSDITAGTPDPTSWGLPQANLQGSCTIDSHFKDHQIIFDTTFCGDYGNALWSTDAACKAKASGGSCSQYVAGNPSAFTNAYWSVNSVKVYQQVGVVSSTIVTAPLTSSTPASQVLAPGMGVSSTTASSASSAFTSGSSNATTTGSSSASAVYQVATRASASASATNPAAIGSFSYLGCASSSSGFSTFIQIDNNPAMSLNTCISECSAYTYAGVFNTLCYCGNSLGTSTSVAPGQGQCRNPCPGNLNEFCGGTITASKKKIRQVSNNVLLSLYQNSNAAGAALVSAVPASQLMGYGMGGGATSVTTIVASTFYINVCNSCAGGYTTVGYTTIIEKCGCVANEVSPATIFAGNTTAAIPMTTVTVPCSSCAANGGAATATVTIPFALVQASAYAALPVVTVSGLSAGQAAAASPVYSTYTSSGTVYTTKVAAAASAIYSTYTSSGTVYTTVVAAKATVASYVPAAKTTGVVLFTGGADKLVGSLGALGVVFAAAVVLL